MQSIPYQIQQQQQHQHQQQYGTYNIHNNVPNMQQYQQRQNFGYYNQIPTQPVGPIISPVSAVAPIIQQSQSQTRINNNPYKQNPYKK